MPAVKLFFSVSGFATNSSSLSAAPVMAHRPRVARVSSWRMVLLRRWEVNTLRSGSEFRSGNLAHPVLLHFSGHGEREAVHELPVLRNLERRDAAVARGSEVVGGQGCAGAEAHPRHHLFAVLRTRHADHLCFDHAGNGVQKLLDLAR